jgi:diguanylate cyclase (GGDEF)-like protein
LLVDDDQDITQVFKLALTRTGYACDTASSGKQALYKLANSRPHLVLLDMRLGREIDGADILYQIRSNPRFDRTRVVIITAYPLMAEEVANLADLVLIKPVTISHLQSLLERLEITVKDIDEGRAVEARDINPFECFRDPITGLFNPSYFYTRLEHAMESARRRPDALFATFVLGLAPPALDESELLSEKQDILLRQVADRLRLNIRPSDAVTRLTGDSFATLHEGLRRPQDTRLIIKRVDDLLARPYPVEGENYQLRFSLGAAIHDRRYNDVRQILGAAQGAMLQARELKEGHCLLVSSFGEQPVAV